MIGKMLLGLQVLFGMNSMKVWIHHAHHDNEVSVLKRPPPDVVEWKILIMHVEKKTASTV